MGQGWRRITETARQKWGMSVEKNFKPTSNSRNEAMFKEATKFANHLRQVETDLKTWQREIESGFTNLRTIMLSPLPRVYEESHTGEATSTEEATLIGPDVQVERLTSAAKDLKGRLDQEVIQPIKQWMSAYRIIQERMNRLEALRLELDSRRRTVHDLQGKLTRITSTLGSSRSKGEADLELTNRKMMHKENKSNHTMEAYQEMERTVYNSLFTLIKDTSVLREYAAAAILIMQDCFTVAYGAFDPTNPQHSSSGAPGALPPFVENKYEPAAGGRSTQDGYGDPAKERSNSGLYKVTPTKAKLPGEAAYGLAPDDQHAGYDQSYDDYPPPAQQGAYQAAPAAQPSGRYTNWAPVAPAGY